MAIHNLKRIDYQNDITPIMISPDMRRLLSNGPDLLDILNKLHTDFRTLRDGQSFIPDIRGQFEVSFAFDKVLDNIEDLIQMTKDELEARRIAYEASGGYNGQHWC